MWAVRLDDSYWPSMHLFHPKNFWKKRAHYPGTQTRGTRLPKVVSGGDFPDQSLSSINADPSDEIMTEATSIMGGDTKATKKVWFELEGKSSQAPPATY